MSQTSPGAVGFRTRCVLIAVSLVTIWAMSRSLINQSRAGTPSVPNAAEAQINEALGLRASSMATLHIRAGNEESLSTTVPLGDGDYTLELDPHSVRSASYRVMIQQADGSLENVAPGAVRTYRGQLAEVDGSYVAASVTADGLHARVVFPGGDEFWVEPVAARVPGTQRDDHAIYRTEDVIPTTAKCDAHAGMKLNLQGENVALATGPACGTGLCIAEIAFDTDVEYFEHWGSATAVEDRINSIINSVNVQYERDVSVRHVITAIIIRPTEPDPYSALDAQAMLTEFRSEWQTNQTGIQRDMAELFTGKAVAGNVIGIAWLNAVCSSYGYSMVESDFTTNFSCTTDLTAHELGHNWAGDHCDCAGDPSYTMNPYITCANQFHPSLTVPDIESYRDAIGCLTAGTNCTVDADCDDGLFCTGVERCSAGICTSDGDPCPGEDCDEAIPQCIPRICNDNGVCEVDENCQNCGGDCVTGSGSACGNNVCEIGAGESCVTCPQDCNGAQIGKPDRRYCCGNAGFNPLTCSDTRCTSSGKACIEEPGVPSCCGDGVCEGVEESCLCSIDCGPAVATESDCADAVDDDCDGDIDCVDADCAADPACVTSGNCGDGVCGTGEDCLSCTVDCAGQTSGRKSNRFCCGDGTTQGPEQQDPSLCDGNN